MARILIIDDETDVRIATRRILERAGHEVTEASSGEEGVESFNKNPADLIITDIMDARPGRCRNGRPATRTASRPADHRNVRSRARRTPRGFQVPAARTIVKPFSLDTLTKMVDEVLRGDEPQEEEEFDGLDELVIDDDIVWPAEDEEEEESDT